MLSEFNPGKSKVQKSAARYKRKEKHECIKPLLLKNRSKKKDAQKDG
jgi:hypothetical protein